MRKYIYVLTSLSTLTKRDAELLLEEHDAACDMNHEASARRLAAAGLLYDRIYPQTETEPELSSFVSKAAEFGITVRAFGVFGG